MVRLGPYIVLKTLNDHCKDERRFELALYGGLLWRLIQ